MSELQNLATFLMAPGQCDWLTGQSIMMDGGNALATGGNFYELRDWSDGRLAGRARAHRGAEREGQGAAVRRRPLLSGIPRGLFRPEEAKGAGSGGPPARDTRHPLELLAEAFERCGADDCRSTHRRRGRGETGDGPSLLAR